MGRLETPVVGPSMRACRWGGQYKMGNISFSVQNKWLSRHPDTQKRWRTTSFQTCGCIYVFHQVLNWQTPKKNDGQVQDNLKLLPCTSDTFLICLIAITDFCYNTYHASINSWTRTNVFFQIERKVIGHYQRYFPLNVTKSRKKTNVFLVSKLWSLAMTWDLRLPSYFVRSEFKHL